MSDFDFRQLEDICTTTSNHSGNHSEVLNELNSLMLSDASKINAVKHFMEHGKIDIVRLLFAAGWHEKKDPMIRDLSLLRYASVFYSRHFSCEDKHNYADILQLVVSISCRIEINQACSMAIMNSRSSYLSIVQILLNHGAQIRNEAVVAACQNAEWKKVRLLLAHGLQLERESREALQCARYCINGGNLPLFKRFMRYLSEDVNIWNLIWCCIRSTTQNSENFFLILVNERIGFDLLMCDPQLRDGLMSNQSLLDSLSDEDRNRLIERDREYNQQLYANNFHVHQISQVISEETYTADTGAVPKIRNLGHDGCCPISLCPLEPGMEVVWCSQCQNGFTKGPMEHWLAHNPKCPTCRGTCPFVYTTVPMMN